MNVEVNVSSARELRLSIADLVFIAEDKYHTPAIRPYGRDRARRNRGLG